LAREILEASPCEQEAATASDQTPQGVHSCFQRALDRPKLLHAEQQQPRRTKRKYNNALSHASEHAILTHTTSTIGEIDQNGSINNFRTRQSISTIQISGKLSVIASF
jgi:hypothetical protein